MNQKYANWAKFAIDIAVRYQLSAFNFFNFVQKYGCSPTADR